MLFFVFLIPESIVCLFLGLLLILGAGIFNGISDFFSFLSKNFWIIVILTLVLLLVILVWLCKKKGTTYTISYFVSVSSIVYVFLGVLYDVVSNVSFNSLLANVLIVIPIVAIYLYLNFIVVTITALKVEEKSASPLRLWVVGGISWLIVLLIML